MKIYTIKIYDVSSSNNIKLMVKIPHKSDKKIDAQIFAEELVFAGTDGVGKMVFVEEYKEYREIKQKKEGENGF